MRVGSVCSGIGAPETAWKSLGWDFRWSSEIDAFAAAVFAARHPGVPNLGDMTNFKEWPDDPVDLLVGGTPCQSFSVAGLRKGMDDPRGNLALTYLAIADRYRPRWLVWENVPGVLSSNSGRDFGAFLGALGKLGYGFAYRVLDAQYVRVDSHPRAVPQRRRRVFVVGHLGCWTRAAAVLFERQSLQGHPAPRRETGESLAPTISARPTAGGGLGTDFDLDGGLVNAYGGNNTRGPIDVATAVNAHGGPHGRQDFESETFVAEHAPSLSASNPYGDHESREGLLVAHSLRGATLENSGPVCTALRSSTGGNTQPMTIQNTAVRRLTPTECERLQGFPDGFTQIPWRNKPADQCPDGPRYKALGNSMAVNVMRWIGKRIQAVEDAT